jgi:SAM-dependent methyltransferase
MFSKFGRVRTFCKSIQSAGECTSDTHAQTAIHCTRRLLINCFVAELRVRIVARKDAGGRASPALPATTRTQRAAILAAETHEWIIQQSPRSHRRTAGNYGRGMATWDPVTYDKAWTEMAAAGKDPHGEVAFVERLLARRGLAEIARPSDSVPGLRMLDAGCGTGRVAVELDRRGYRVEGTDVDADMLGEASSKAPQLVWTKDDLARLALGREFDLIVLSGNVILFVEPGDRPLVAPSLRAHVPVGALVVQGMQLARTDGRRVPVEQLDEWMLGAGFVLSERWATWDEDAWTAEADYAVSVHQAV